MEILIAEHSGFCEGVERAYRIALERTKAGRAVFMLGNLVHNTKVVEKFINLGIKAVKDLSEIKKGTNGVLLISAHGVAPKIYEKAKELELEIVDTTCPWVKKAQKIAKDLAGEGRFTIIVGDKGHPEVAGLVGWSADQAIVIEKPGEVDKLGLSKDMKVGVLAQTTQSDDNFDAVVARLKQKVSDLEEYDTICGATSKRQDAAVEAAKKVDLMLVIGDFKSANTKRLTELCARTGTETHQIQTVAELDRSWLSGKNKVGITAGASTPEWIISEVTALLRAPQAPDKSKKR